MKLTFTSQRLTEIGMIAGSLLLLLVVLYLSSQTLSQINTDTRSTGTQAGSTPVVPDIMLNNAHQRQGEVIQVNPDNLGRTNPFIKP